MMQSVDLSSLPPPDRARSGCLGSIGVKPGPDDRAAPPKPTRRCRSGLSFLVKPRNELDVRFDPAAKTVWCSMRHANSVSWTLPLLRELNALSADIRALYEGQAFDEPPIRFFVGGSLRPGVFNMGGDLSYFLDRVRAKDEEGLRAIRLCLRRSRSTIIITASIRRS